ncbi:MAG: hypothetical protein ACI8R8_003004, partial [Paraglaciecola sp.]
VKEPKNLRIETSLCLEIERMLNNSRRPINLPSSIKPQAKLPQYCRKKDNQAAGS